MFRDQWNITISLLVIQRTLPRRRMFIDKRQGLRYWCHMNIEFLKEAHKDAFEENKDLLPILNLMDALKYIRLYFADQNSLEDIKTELVERHKEFTKQYLNGMAEKAINGALAEFADHPMINKLNDEEFAHLMVNAGKRIMIQVGRLAHKEIDLELFVDDLFGTEIKDIAVRIMQAADIDVKTLMLNRTEILKVANPSVMYQVWIAVYRELRKSYEELALARAERIRVEAECEKCIRMIKAYREEMEAEVSRYLGDHYAVFEAGFEAMNQAMIDDDIDGFISGNVMIQEALGYDVQYRNQAEFEELMYSDEPFEF